MDKIPCLIVGLSILQIVFWIVFTIILPGPLDSRQELWEKAKQDLSRGPFRALGTFFLASIVAWPLVVILGTALAFDKWHKR